MSDPTPFDEFRDLLDGRLDEAAAAGLRARFARDPALKAEFDTYAGVHAFTAPGTGAVPQSTATFERLDAARRAQRVRRLRPWAAAAAALFLVAAGAATWRQLHPARSTVVLQSISLSAPIDCAPVMASSVPAELAAYRPVVDGSVHWIDSLDKGREIARFTGRPVFLWVYHPMCPVCVEWDEQAFRDGDVQAKAAEFVPVRINAEKAGQEVLALVKKAGWPYLGVMTADGRNAQDFAGIQSTDQIRGHLDKALGAQKSLGAVLAWDVANELGAAMVRGRKALETGDYLAAYAEFRRVEVTAPEGLLRSAAVAGVCDVADAAASTLSNARRLDESEDPTERRAGARSLSEAAERFRGTPYGTDLAEVEQELRATGRFPVLVESDGTERIEK